jgi:hypothetical protein
MTENDLAALRSCIEICLAKIDDSTDVQVRDMLAHDPWNEVARFASYSCQSDALNLKPWDEPPCVAREHDPNERDKKAQRLLRKMLAAGVSRYHPDPLAALEAVRAPSSPHG